MLHRLIDWATSLPVLHAASLIGLAAWSLAFVVFVARIPGPLDASGQKVGGDYFNFFAAGRMVLEGEGAALYDLRVQQRNQQQILNNPQFDSLAVYINPPLVALLCAPLAALPFNVGFVIYSLLMLTAFLFAMRKLLRWTPGLQPHAFIVIALCLLFFPMIRTITGGQSTALTFLLYCGLYDSFRRKAGVECGLWLACLTYKPQLLCLLPFLFLLHRKWTTLAVFMTGCILHYLIGAAMCGTDWPQKMSEAVQLYIPLETAVSSYTLISIKETLATLFTGAATSAFTIVLSLIVAAATFYAPIRRGAGVCSSPALWAALIPATLLISPHAQFYDVGQLIFSILLLLQCRFDRGEAPSRKLRGLLAAAFVFFPIYPVAQFVGFQPLLILVIVVWAWAIRETISATRVQQPSSAPPRLAQPESSHAG